MKKLTAVLLIAAMLFAFAACGEKPVVEDDLLEETPVTSVTEAEEEIEAASETDSEESETELPEEETALTETEDELIESESESEPESETEKETGSKTPKNDQGAEKKKEPSEEKKEEDKPKGKTYTYYITVDCSSNTVTVYTYDDNGEYTVPVKSMICSTGSSTPKSGSYNIRNTNHYTWHALFGGVYGQYCTQVTGNILFHSVPYTKNKDHGSLEYWEFDKLGTSCSAGCIRLQVKDAKWIYDNRTNVSAVKFTNTGSTGPLGRPSAPKISGNERCRGWDPTDPAAGNPWRDSGVTTDPVTEPDTGTETEPVTPEPEPDTEPDPDTDTEPDPDTDTEPDADTDPEPEPEPEPDPVPEPDPGEGNRRAPFEQTV